MNRFLPREVLLILKFEIKLGLVLKVDIKIVGLVFSISNYLINKIAQGRNLFMEKNYLLEITLL